MRRVLPCILLLAAASCGQPDTDAVPIEYAQLDLARHGHRIERLGDTLYAFGGFAEAGRTPDRGMRQVFTFELPEGPWRPRADMVGGHAFFGSGVLGARLFAIGGTVERYDAGADRWSAVAVKTRLPKSHFASAPWKGRLHVLGGYPIEAADHWTVHVRKRP
jgi:hypothetical protein